jgi:serine/threonine protein kinase/tetratricopeptide (TPR) repeat protein
MQQLFEAALLLEEGDWPTFLSSRCGSDSELADKVRQLLIADRDSKKFLADEPFVAMPAMESASTRASLQLHHILCGRFQLLAYLGEGGMGQVYEALDLELHQRIAIKAIRPEIAELPGVLSRFKREVYTTRRITHPNVCRTFDLERHVGPVSGRDGPESSITFLTMELLQGQTLAERIKGSGPLASAEILQVALQLCYALNAAHAVGVVHCDLKPSNIFLTEPQPNLRVVVTDFGIARIIHSESRSLFFPTHSQGTPSGPAAGTPAYMAPEQFERGQCSPASDIYSFGLILYEAMTGERLYPLSRSPEQVHTKISNAGSDKEQAFQWSGLLASCLQADPVARFSNIQQVLDLLEGKCSSPLANLTPFSAKPSVQLQSAQLDRTLQYRAQSVLTGRSLWMAVVVLVICLAAGVFWYRRLVPSTPAQASVASVVVLPFDNPGGESDLKLLGNNFSASLTNDLARFTGLTVPSETALTGLGSHPDIGLLGQRLHVDNVVNGSVTRTPRSLLLQVALVDAKTGVHRWGQGYLSKDGDITSLDEDVSLEIAFLLRRDLQAAGNYANAHRSTTVATAQEAFRRGEAALTPDSSPNSEVAANNFQQAIDADPEFAPAYERLADCYLRMANKYLRPEAALDLRTKAESFALRSLELDESSAAFVDLAKTKVFRNFDWKRAEENFNRAVELDPNDVSAHAAFAFYVLTPQGRFAEARAQHAYADRATSKKLSNEYKEAIGEYFARHYQSSLDQAQQLKQEHPEVDVLTELVAEDYIGMNDPSKAIKFLEATTSQTEDGRIAHDALLGVALAKSGRKSEAERILARLVAERKPNFGLSFHLGALSLAVGDRRGALTYIKRAVATRETSVLFIGVDTLMDPIRLDPHFQHLLLGMNLNNSNETGGR